MSNPVGGEPREPDEPIPPGEYLLALVWFTRRESLNQNWYLRCRFVVAAGPMKGRGFFCPWSLDTSKPGCRKRWELWMEQVGCTEEIDLDDDATIARIFKGSAFKAQVKVTERNGYRNNDLDRLIYTRNYGVLDRKDIDAWNQEWKERGWEQQDPGAHHTDADAPPDREEPQWSDESGMADNEGDDDCPF